MSQPTAYDNKTDKADSSHSSNALISDDINDIISNTPPWMVRNGASLIGLVALICLAGSWFIRYPDTLSVQMKMVATAEPMKVLAQTDGRLKSLLVAKGETVNKHQPLAYLDSDGDHKVVLSPTYGYIRYATALLESQPVKEAQELFYIEPEGHILYGEIITRHADHGKFFIGQSLTVQSEHPESLELEGKVLAITPLTDQESSFLIQVKFQHTMIAYNKVVPFSRKIKVNVITQESRLLEKLFYNTIIK